LKEDKDEFDYTATNILTQIDRLSKHVSDVREEYDYFSDILHPNSLGTLLHFSNHEELDEYRSVVRFTDDNKQETERWLVVAASLLSLMDIVMSTTEKRLNERSFL
jgi:hypothetical protein